jgi:hypothetical protein
MQTFVPHEDNSKTATSLDRQRLGKQRVEAWQILLTLNKGEQAKGWKNHPAVKMWRGHEWALCLYAEAICKEWIGRGYKDTMLPRFQTWRAENPQVNKTPPMWWGDVRVHASHRSKLLEKNLDHYAPHFPNDEAGSDYHWPIT